MMKKIFFLLLLATQWSGIQAEVDPNFYIYICFGQSNMEGNAQWETMDNTVDARFKLLATCNFSSPSRTMGNWYKATPPLVSPQGKLGPTDYFGRTMVAALPANVKIGVIPVAMGGSPIEMFDKDKYQQKLNDNPNEWWATLAKNHYGGNPYGRIIEMAKKAQKVGVIKGILLHQGCSNCGDPNWPNMVKKIYNDMLTDLSLGADSVPLFVGEVEYADMGGSCASHNAVVAKIPSVIPTGHVISAAGLPGNGSDPWHFSAKGYRHFGVRYAYEALRLMGCETIADPDYAMSTTLKKFYGAKSVSIEKDIVAVPGQRIPVTVVYNDGYSEDATAQTTFTSNDLVITDGALASKGEGKGIVTATYTDFARQSTTTDINVEVRYFPFAKQALRQLSGTLTLDEENRDITLTAGGQAGWVYDNFVDLSDYKYLVVKLREPQTCRAQVRVYTSTDVTAGHYTCEIGSNTVVGIDLSKLKYSNKKINPSRIKLIDFYCASAGTLKIEDVYVTENDDFSPSAIQAVQIPAASDGNVYSLQGIKVATTSQWSQLRSGVYIVGGKLIQKK